MSSVTRLCAAAVLLSLSSCAPPAPTLERLLDLNADARGGKPALEGVDSVRVELHLVEPEFEAELVYVAMRPDMARVDVKIGGEHVFTEAVNAEGAWQRSGSDPVERTGAAGTAALRRGAVGNLYGLHEFPGLGYELRLVEPLEVDGTRYHAIEITSPDGRAEVQYLDPESHLVTRKRDVRAIHPDLDPTERRVENTFLDFREVDGILRPFRILNHDLDDGERLQETTVRSVTLNAAVDPAVFDYPSEP